MADVQSNIQVSIDTTQALASIKNLQRQISAFHSSIAKGGAAANAVSAQMQQTLINSINATGKFSAQIRTIRTTTESFTSALEKNKFSLGEYFRYAGGATRTFGRLFKTEHDTINKVARENVKDLQTQYIRMGRDASGAMKAIAVRPLSLDMTDLATRTQIAAQKQAILNQLLKQGSTNLLNFGKNTQWAGRQLMVGFTLPLIALGSAASKTFMDMETQAIRFKKVYGDLFTPQTESVKALKDIQELGKEFTKYGIAVSTTVGLAAEAAAAGFKGVDLQRQTAAATRLSILGQVESQKALETTIALQNAFSMSSENLAESIDFLNAVENQTVLSLDDVSTAIPKAAPVIQQLGGDVKDLAFFMTAMKEGGINASEGANALKSGLASMINPTGKAAAMLESFGINVKKIVLDNKGDLKKTVVEFATALNMLDPLNRAQAIEQMFGKFQFARLSTLFANVTKEGTQASRVLDLAGASVQDLASLSEKELGMTSESAMNKFKGAVENLKLSLIPLGEQFLKAVTPIAEFITRVLDKFNSFSDTTKKIIVVITGIVAGLGPVLLMTAGLVMNGLANMIKLFAFLKSAFNKTGQSTATLGTEVKYMTTEQRNAAAVAASLDQVHTKLAQTFTSEASAVNALTRAYQRAIAAQSQFVPVAPPITRGPIKKFAGGRPATVGGTGNKDSELALLMPGETVIPTAMSEKYGSIINAMIADRIPGYDDGKPKTGSPSLYGGQSLKYSGLGVFAPGNTSSSVFGMDRGFLMEGDSFLKSLTATAVGGGATLDDPVARLTRARTLEYHGAVKTFVPRIVDVLRSTVREMEQNGENIGSIEDVTRRARPKLEKIFGQMTAQGGKAASSATALRQHLFFPGQAEMGGQFGETRVPGARRSSSGRIKDTMYRIKGSPFQSRVRTAYRNLFGANPEGSYAHMNESRMLGDDVPLRGGALALPASEQAPLAARVRAKARQIKTDFAGGITKRRSGAEKAAIRQSGADDKREYVRGADSVDGKDPYIQTRDRKSPHRQAAKDGRDDARAYTTARDKELTQAGRRRRVATRPQGPAPIGATPQPGMTVLPIVPPDPKDKNNKSEDGKPKKRLTGMGGGMGIFGANMALSMVPDFAGKGIVQGGLAGASLGMMFGPYGMGAGAVIGTATSIIAKLIEKEKEHAANVKATFTPSTEIISAFGDKVFDATVKVTNLGMVTKNVKTGFGVISPEIQAIVDAISKLPEDNPLSKLIKRISDSKVSLSSLIGSIRSNVSTAISTGGLDPKNAEKYVQAILAAANRTKDFATVWKAVSKDVVDAQTATTTSFNKLDEAVTKTGDAFFFIDAMKATSGLKNYKDLNGAQQSLADELLTTFSIIANGTLTLDQINERIAGLNASSLDASVGVDALMIAVKNTGNADLISRVNMLSGSFDEVGKSAEKTAPMIMMMNLAVEMLASQQKTIASEQARLFGTGASSVSGTFYTLQNILNDSQFDDFFKKWQESLNTVNDYQDPEDGVDGLSKATEAYLKVLDAEIKALEAKRDAQKNANDETQRQIDLQMKLKDIANQAVLAKISGDYIKAANLEQQAQNVQVEFDQETELRKKDAEIARLKARAEAIRGGAKLTKAESAKIPKVKAASGGAIRGAGTGTSDSIPAYLSNGEYVIKAKSVKKYGTETFDALNAGRFADGGLIQDPNKVYLPDGSEARKMSREERDRNYRISRDRFLAQRQKYKDFVMPQETPKELANRLKAMGYAEGGLIKGYDKGGLATSPYGPYVPTFRAQRPYGPYVPSFPADNRSDASKVWDFTKNIFKEIGRSAEWTARVLTESAGLGQTTKAGAQSSAWRYYNPSSPTHMDAAASAAAAKDPSNYNPIPFLSKDNQATYDYIAALRAAGMDSEANRAYAIKTGMSAVNTGSLFLGGALGSAAVRGTVGAYGLNKFGVAGLETLLPTGSLTYAGNAAVGAGANIGVNSVFSKLFGPGGFQVPPNVSSLVPEANIGTSSTFSKLFGFGGFQVPKSFTENSLLRQKFEAIKAEGKLLTPEGDAARVALAQYEALMAARLNNFTPLMDLRRTTSKQLIAENQAMPSVIEEPLTLNGKEFTFKFTKHPLAQRDAPAIDDWLQTIQDPKSGLGRENLYPSVSARHQVEVIDPLTGKTVASISYDSITGAIGYRYTDKAWQGQGISEFLYNKAASMSRIRHSKSLSDEGRASAPKIGGFMASDDIYGLPGLATPSSTPSLKTTLQEFIQQSIKAIKPIKPKKPKKSDEPRSMLETSLEDQRLSTIGRQDDRFLTYRPEMKSGLRPETIAWFGNPYRTSQNFPYGNNGYVEPGALAELGRLIDLEQEAAARGIFPPGAISSFEDAMTAWRNNPSRTYNSYPGFQGSGSYIDPEDLFDMQRLQSAPDTAAGFPWAANESQYRFLRPFDGGNITPRGATGGLLDKGKFRVPKFANGGLIKGPGTGISDSIRATLGYAGGGSIRVSNGEYVVKASSVRDYGVKTMDAINNGTARVGTESGGTVYNINMPVTSNNANPEIVANEVMRKLKLEISKNNKTNKVGG